MPYPIPVFGSLNYYEWFRMVAHHDVRLAARGSEWFEDDLAFALG